ncbi:hypothetical protein O9K51_08229 [Purpureocillium lavendulum]|uniref:Uncharacterized protein n=1 Tax=Purpureocillium lavendulum TaxID=1247861 RepID=A0AB34FIP4_9HYPO|nr:hypothetical protein O9K51_08229 [Purpureocillium lavendulum]
MVKSSKQGGVRVVVVDSWSVILSSGPNSEHNVSGTPQGHRDVVLDDLAKDSPVIAAAVVGGIVKLIGRWESEVEGELGCQYNEYGARVISGEASDSRGKDRWQ